MRSSSKHRSLTALTRRDMPTTDGARTRLLAQGGEAMTLEWWSAAWAIGLAVATWRGRRAMGKSSSEQADTLSPSSGADFFIFNIFI
jgi:hypothetical protein